MRAHKVGMRSIWWPMSAFGEWFLKARMISETFGKIFFPRSFSLIKNSAETFFSAFEGNFPSDFPLVTMENRVFPFAQFSISQFHIRERTFQDSRACSPSLSRKPKLCSRKNCREVYWSRHAILVLVPFPSYLCAPFYHNKSTRQSHLNTLAASIRCKMYQHTRPQHSQLEICICFCMKTGRYALMQSSGLCKSRVDFCAC